jgi:hypothetical protein
MKPPKKVDKVRIRLKKGANRTQIKIFSKKTLKIFGAYKKNP